MRITQALQIGQMSIIPAGETLDDKGSVYRIFKGDTLMEIIATTDIRLAVLRALAIEYEGIDSQWSEYAGRSLGMANDIWTIG